MKWKTKEEIPEPPYDSYRVFSDNKLRKGVVTKHHYIEVAPSLIGTPVVKYEDWDNIPRDEKYTIPYLCDICISPKEAWENHKQSCLRTKELYEGSVDSHFSQREEIQSIIKSDMKVIVQAENSIKIAEEEISKLENSN